MNQEDSRLGRRGSEGNILVVSLGLLLMMTFLGIGLFYTVERDFSIEEGVHERAGAFDAAETGAQTGLYWLEDRALVGNYPDTSLVNATVPSVAAGGTQMNLSQQSGCHGYARFISMNVPPAGAAVANQPSAVGGAVSDLLTPPAVVSTAPVGLAPCLLLTLPGAAALATPGLLPNTQYEFFVTALPVRVTQGSGAQIGVSGVYGQGGQDIEYPYRVRSVGRHLPNAATPANFDSQVIIDLWAHYRS